MHILAPPGTRFDHPGCRLKRTRWLPERHIVRGLPNVTTPLRTAWEIASEPDLIEAVVILDELFRARRPHKESLDSWVAARRA